MKIEFLPTDRSVPPGHPPASRYVRRFWTPLVGAEPIACYIAIVEALEEGRSEIQPIEMADAIGLGSRDDLAGCLARLVRDRLASATPVRVAVRRNAPSLTLDQEERLPPILQVGHRRLRQDGLVTPAPAPPRDGEAGAAGEMIERARKIGLSLLRLGVPVEDLDSALSRRKFHPAISHQAAEWARRRHTEASLEVADALDAVRSAVGRLDAAENPNEPARRAAPEFAGPNRPA